MASAAGAIVVLMVIVGWLVCRRRRCGCMRLRRSSAKHQHVRLLSRAEFDGDGDGERESSGEGGGGGGHGRGNLSRVAARTEAERLALAKQNAKRAERYARRVRVQSDNGEILQTRERVYGANENETQRLVGQEQGQEQEGDRGRWSGMPESFCGTLSTSDSLSRSHSGIMSGSSPRQSMMFLGAPTSIVYVSYYFTRMK